jgi:hypothetical protein
MAKKKKTKLATPFYLKRGGRIPKFYNGDIYPKYDQYNTPLTVGEATGSTTDMPTTTAEFEAGANGMVGGSQGTEAWSDVGNTLPASGGYFGDTAGFAAATGALAQGASAIDKAVTAGLDPIKGNDEMRIMQALAAQNEEEQIGSTISDVTHSIVGAATGTSAWDALRQAAKQGSRAAGKGDPYAKFGVSSDVAKGFEGFFDPFGPALTAWGQTFTGSKGLSDDEKAMNIATMIFPFLGIGKGIEDNKKKRETIDRMKAEFAQERQEAAKESHLEKSKQELMDIKNRPYANPNLFRQGSVSGYLQDPYQNMPVSAYGGKVPKLAFGGSVMDMVTKAGLTENEEGTGTGTLKEYINLMRGGFLNKYPAGGYYMKNAPATRSQPIGNYKPASQPSIGNMYNSPSPKRITPRGVAIPYFYGDEHLLFPDGGTHTKLERTSGPRETPTPQVGSSGMMKARLAYEDMQGNPAAKRMVAGTDTPYAFPEGHKDYGKTGTHYMMSMDNYAVPLIQQQGNSLMLGDYTPYSSEAMRFDRPEDARYFAENYKQVAPAFRAMGGSLKMPYAMGGIHIKPSKRGTFTAAAKERGMGVQEFASKVMANKDEYSPAMVKKANFARNAAKWKKGAYGMELPKYMGGGALKMPKYQLGGQAMLQQFGTNQAVPTSSDTAMLQGDPHGVESDGDGKPGVPMYNPQTGQQNGEAEGKEGVWNQGDSVKIFSNRLVVPGTDKTFAQVFNELSKQKGNAEKIRSAKNRNQTIHNIDNQLNELYAVQRAMNGGQGDAQQGMAPAGQMGQPPVAPQAAQMRAKGGKLPKYALGTTKDDEPITGFDYTAPLIEEGNVSTYNTPVTQQAFADDLSAYTTQPQQPKGDSWLKRTGQKVGSWLGNQDWEKIGTTTADIGIKTLPYIHAASQTAKLGSLQGPKKPITTEFPKTRTRPNTAPAINRIQQGAQASIQKIGQEVADPAMKAAMQNKVQTEAMRQVGAVEYDADVKALSNEMTAKGAYYSARKANDMLRNQFNEAMRQHDNTLVNRKGAIESAVVSTMYQQARDAKLDARDMQAMEMTIEAYRATGVPGRTGIEWIDAMWEKVTKEADKLGKEKNVTKGEALAYAPVMR